MAISIADINGLVSSVSSNSLTALASASIPYSGGSSTVVTNDVKTAPHAMKEWTGYVHETPYTSMLTGAQLASVAGPSMTASGTAAAFSSSFSSADAIAGFDMRFQQQYLYNQYTGYMASTAMAWRKTSGGSSSWYDDINNTEVYMTPSGSVSNIYTIASAFGAGVDFHKPNTVQANEVMLQWIIGSVSVSGATTDTTSSVTVTGAGIGSTAMANGTWYTLPSTGIFNGGATLKGIFTKFFTSTGTAHFECTVTLKTWIRNTSQNKSATMIREQDIRLYADATIVAGSGGGCPWCCVHDSMLIATEEDMKSIYDISIGDKVISHNFETGKDEVVEVTDLIIVDRDVDYKINDLVMTEDHPVYLEGGRKASLNPDATLLNYKQEVDQLVIGDRMMKLDGTLEEITSIEKFEGEHKNFAVQTKHNNFYANGHLVDSVINRGTK